MICPYCKRSFGGDKETCPHDGFPLVADRFAQMLLAAEGDLQPGYLVGGFQIEEKIDEGGMGAVYRAVQPVIGKLVAVKVLSAKLSSDPEMVARFIQEARAVNMIRHPNIVDIIDLGVLEDGRRFLVMELLMGMSLEKYLQKNATIPLGEMLLVLGDVCAALDAAHRQGVVHRDLKPGNIFLMLDGHGRPRAAKLLDFGIARLLDTSELPEGAERPRTRTGMFIGTPAYMSPEQACARPVEKRSDIYSLGVVTYRMLTGQLPFQADSPALMLQKHLTEEPPAPSSCGCRYGEALDPPVLKSLSKEPADRFDSAGEFFRALEEALRRTPPAVPKAPDTPSTPTHPGGGLSTETKIDSLTVFMPPAHPDATVLYPGRSPAAPQPPVPGPTPPAPSPSPGSIPRADRGMRWLAGVSAIFVCGVVTWAWISHSNDAPASDSGREQIDTSVLEDPSSHYPASPATIASKVGDTTVTMLRIPGGEVRSGENGTGRVRAFYLDRMEVTIEQYLAFLAANPQWKSSGIWDDQDYVQRHLAYPVPGVTARAADAFCRWAGKRLPTEQEWARAARGDDDRTFPWGNTVDRSAARALLMRDTIRSAEKGIPTISTESTEYARDRSPYGALGLAGSLREWTAPEAGASSWPIRGGGWSTRIVDDLMVDRRSQESPDYQANWLGFRCARDEGSAGPARSPQNDTPAPASDSRLTHIQSESQLRICADDDAAPMLFKTEKGDYAGFELELARDIARHLKAEVAIVAAPYSELPGMLREGKCDILLAAYIPDDDIEDVAWSQPYLELGLALVVRSDSPITSVRDLGGKRIGIYDDPAAEDAVKLLAPGFKSLQKYEDGYWPDLEKGKIDAVLYDYPFAQYELKNDNYLGKLKFVQYNLTSSHYSVGVKAGDSVLLAAVDEAIKASRSAPEYRERVKEYLGDGAVIPEVRPGAPTYTVRDGDSLSSIAIQLARDVNAWPELWEANKSRIGYPDLIFPGMKLELPDTWASSDVTAAARN